MHYNEYPVLKITSPAFKDNSFIPVEYTGYDEDYSPELILHNISEKGKSIVIIMDDLDIPMISEYNHWLIWNIPIQNIIPKAIPYGKVVTELDDAQQGIGYGTHQYKGPKPPKFIRNKHRYKFNVFILDCMVNLSSESKKRDLLKAIDNHILQYGYITGLYKN